MDRPRTFLLLVLLIAGCSAQRAQMKPIILDTGNIKDEVCPVHSEKLIEAIEPLEHGSGIHAPEYTCALQSDFPYAFVGMRTMGKETHWVAHYCPKCREVEREWQKNWKSGRQ